MMRITDSLEVGDPFELTAEQIDDRISKDLDSAVLREILQNLSRGMHRGNLNLEALLDMPSGVAVHLALGVLKRDELKHALFILLLTHYRRSKTDDEFERWITGEDES